MIARCYVLLQCSQCSRRLYKHDVTDDHLLPARLPCLWFPYCFPLNEIDFLWYAPLKDMISTLFSTRIVRAVYYRFHLSIWSRCVERPLRTWANSALALFLFVLFATNLLGDCFFFMHPLFMATMSYCKHGVRVLKIVSRFPGSHPAHQKHSLYWDHFNEYFLLQKMQKMKHDFYHCFFLHTPRPCCLGDSFYDPGMLSPRPEINTRQPATMLL